MPQTNQSSQNPCSSKNMSDWLKRETPEKRKALENASRHFDKNDALDVHTLEGVYAKESSFGRSRGHRGSSSAAGDFQIKKATAHDVGLKVDRAVDERFDIDHAAAAAAKLLKNSNNHFEKSTRLSKGIRTYKIENPEERKKFALAAYNAGETRIARAQQLANDASENPANWEDVKKYLEKAGAKKPQAAETRDYVDKISDFEKDFRKCSKADPKAKHEATQPVPTGTHWITKDGRHILVRDRHA